jgi:hypothetical protein
MVVCKNNFVAVLLLAWAYMLSALWVKVMPGSCFVRYNEQQTPYHYCRTEPLDKNLVNIDIGNASSKEARWWAAILARGQGWQATMALELDTYSSPWSISLQSGPLLCYRRR